MPRPVAGGQSIAQALDADAKAKAAALKTAAAAPAIARRQDHTSGVHLNAGAVQPPSIQISDRGIAASNAPRVPKREGILFEEEQPPQPKRLVHAKDREHEAVLPPPMVKDDGHVRSLSKMSYEDLHELFRLCAGNEAEVVQTLARLWQMDPSAIRPLVRSWFSIATFPPIVPPSRSRSAPPVLSPTLKRRLEAMAAELGVVPRAQPAGLSAPVYGSSGRPTGVLPSVLSALNEATARLHESSGMRQHDARSRAASGSLSRTDLLTFPQQPEYAHLLPTRAEMASLPTPDERQDMNGGPMEPMDALASFMARQGPQYGHASILPTAGAAWRAMNHGTQRMALGWEPNRQVTAITLSGGRGLAVAQRHALRLQQAAR